MCAGGAIRASLFVMQQNSVASPREEGHDLLPLPIPLHSELGPPIPAHATSWDSVLEVSLMLGLYLGGQEVAEGLPSQEAAMRGRRWCQKALP